MNLTKLVKEYGVKNLSFVIPFEKTVHLQHGFFTIPTVSQTEFDLCECYISEDTYPIKNNYKIELVKKGSQQISFFKDMSVVKVFYVSDLESLLKRESDRYKVYALVDDPVYYQRLN